MRYGIDRYKTSNLTPDEQNLLRKHAHGLWVFCGDVQAENIRAALRVAREQLTDDKVRINKQLTRNYQS